MGPPHAQAGEPLHPHFTDEQTKAQISEDCMTGGGRAQTRPQVSGPQSCDPTSTQCSSCLPRPPWAPPAGCSAPCPYSLYYVPHSAPPPERGNVPGEGGAKNFQNWRPDGITKATIACFLRQPSDGELTTSTCLSGKSTEFGVRRTQARNYSPLELCFPICKMGTTTLTSSDQPGQYPAWGPSTHQALAPSMVPATSWGPWGPWARPATPLRELMSGSCST